MNEAQILEFAGLFVVLFGIGFIVSGRHYLRLLDAIKNNSAILLTFGGLNLIIGYLIVTNYNTWIWDWTIIVTIIGWMALLKGMVIMVFPTFHLQIADWSLNVLGKRAGVLGGVLLVLGVVLIYIARSLI